MSGTAVKVSIKCSGTTGQKCPVTLTLSVTETIRNGKVIAITAKKKKPKTKKKTVVIGRMSATLVVGQRKTLTVSLNRTGKQLLARRHVLRAKLTVTERGKAKPVLVKTVTFHVQKKKKKH